MESGIEPPNDTGSANQDTNHGSQDPPRWYWSWTVLTNIVIAAATAAIFWNSCTQSGEAHKDLRAYAISRAGDVRELAASDRGPRSMVNQFVIQIFFTNYGKSPAKNARAFIDYKLFPFDTKQPRNQTPELPRDLGCPSNRAAGTFAIAADPNSQESSRTLYFSMPQADEVGAIFSNPPTQILIAYGCVKYDDIFDEQHCSTFAAKLIPENTARGLDLDFGVSQHNELDGCS